MAEVPEKITPPAPKVAITSPAPKVVEKEPEELTEETLDVTDHSVYAQVKNVTAGVLDFEHGLIQPGKTGAATQAELFYQAAFIEKV
jgi:hypothetical protein